jgi:hypothetical protein
MLGFSGYVVARDSGERCSETLEGSSKLEAQSSQSLFRTYGAPAQRLLDLFSREGATKKRRWRPLAPLWGAPSPVGLDTVVTSPQIQSEFFDRDLFRLPTLPVGFSASPGVLS